MKSLNNTVIFYLIKEHTGEKPTNEVNVMKSFHNTLFFSLIKEHTLERSPTDAAMW